MGDVMDRNLEVLDYLLREGRPDDARKVINSINDNQMKCKTWLVESLIEHLELFENPNILVAAGWFGLTGHLLHQKGYDKVTVIDIDPKCKEIGKKLYPELKHKTQDINSINLEEYDFIICTSCEHITDDEINNFLSKRATASMVALQSNDYFKVPEHINCKDSLKEFQDSLSLNVIESKEKEMERYTRYMVIGT